MVSNGVKASALRDGGAQMGLAIHEAMDVIRRLRDLGVDKDVDLPRICVVGKQSSGKSSIMEALTGIAVPRAGGTCTRCAFEISTQDAAEDFRCVVSVRGADFPRLDLIETRRVEEVTELLQLAQKLLLCPDALKKFREMNQEAGISKSIDLDKLKMMLSLYAHGEGRDSLITNVKEFTNDVVQVRITGNGYKELQLIDLPGLIASFPKKELIDLIRHMAKEYLEKPNTLIAMCCPFDDDLENQEIREIAKTLDPDGRRTVGILTKADRLPEGQEAAWMKILLNQQERYQLLHGYFAVKNPGQPELEGLSNEEAREKEEEFFRGECWQAAKDRCGTKQLRECLCQLLHDLVNQQLPDVQKELIRELEVAKKELEGLGEAIKEEDAVPKLLSLLQKVKSELSKSVEAEDRQNLAFWKSVEGSSQQLKHDCFALRPLFVVQKEALDDQELSDKHELSSTSVKLGGWEDWELVTKSMNSYGVLEKGTTLQGGTSIPDGMRPSDFQSWKRAPGCSVCSDCWAYVSKDNFPENCPSGWKKSWIDDGHKHFDTYFKRPQALISDSPSWPFTLYMHEVKDEQVLSVETVQRMIEERRGRELKLPGGPAGYISAVEIVHQAIKLWKDPATKCIDDASAALNTLVEEVVCCTIPVERFPKVHESVMRFLVSSVDDATEKCHFRKEALFTHELSKDLYTQNDHYLQDSFNKTQCMVRRSMGLAINWQKLKPEDALTVRQLLQKAGLTSTEDLIAPSMHDDAIWCMSLAFAYHKVAFKRFCDNLPREVDTTLLRVLVQVLPEQVFKGLRDDCNGQFHRLFEEDPKTAAKRKSLQEKVGRLSKGLEVLKDSSPSS